jgi:hypothetical protein
MERGGSSIVGCGRSGLVGHCYYHVPTVYKTVSLMTIGKPEAATAVYKLLMMGMRMPETC